ncbi:MAG: signal recognition particle-docking protein FtsY [Alphaproteobacteria bacterium]|jgi:fused signal recognition particle receptor|nr:signal recognition particle-docking protein FtsY [Alphaproteobacteria bacterium]
MGLFRSAFGRVRKGLAKTRDTFVGGLRSMLLGRQLDEQLLEDLERRLIESDIGVRTATRLIESLRDAYRARRISTGEQVLEYLKQHMADYWPEADRQLHIADSGPTVILVAGINGAGKTTSIAKIARALIDDGRSVALAACDTFRAAAVEQLEIWSRRLGVHVVKGKQGGDPAAVAFDACEAALARDVDVLLVDTAGRLHTQEHLMRQLTKIRDVCAKRIAGAPHEVMLVLDATTGQNAIQQAKLFKDAIDVTGIFLAKLDGTARGGIVVAIREQVDIPVKFIGVGETPEDVEPFDPHKFVEALFAES